jgi:hypothetical protein
VLCTNVVQPSTSLISSPFVNDVENRLPTNIEDVNDNRVIEIDVIS